MIPVLGCIATRARYADAPGISSATESAVWRVLTVVFSGRRGFMSLRQAGQSPRLNRKTHMALSDNLRGCLLMTLAMVAFTVNDSFMKAATADFPVLEAIFIRGCLTTFALAIIAGRSGVPVFRFEGRDRLWLILRSVGEVTSTLTFLFALKHMPIANLSAIMQCLPLAVTLASAVILKESIGWRRLAAIGVGFVGVMLIVRPGTEGFDVWSVLGLLSVAMVVLRDLSTKRMSRKVPSSSVALLAAFSVTLSAGVPLMFGDFEPVSARQLVQIVGAGLCLIVGYLAAVMTMRVGDIAVVAPFRYTSLVAAILLGWAAFGQFPDGWTIIGSAIVVATGVYTFHRERLRARLAASDKPVR